MYENSSLRAMASAINVAGGGRQFAAGGPTNPFDNSRGPVSSGNAGSAAAANSLVDYDMIGKVIADQMKDAIMRIQVTNNLQETKKGIATLNKLQSEADV